MQIAYTLNDIDLVAGQLLEEYSQKKKFAFSGEVGAGKTTLIQALCKLLGVTDEVDSPTFSIVNEYEGHKNRILHIDLYRMSTSDLDSIGLDAYFEKQDNFVFIEWPEKIPSLLTEEFVFVKIEQLGMKRQLLAMTLDL